MRLLRIGSLVLLAALTAVSGLLAQASRQEESEDYYKKWVEQDVTYIITEDELDVFQSLTTPEEKDAFIEQFWHRRDPDLTTAVNEYKEEHYRRISFVNDRYGSGIPGWKTDRGRIYITFGEPDEVEYNPGGPYIRKPWEGGGRTNVFPFEIWTYNHIPGIGQDVEVEFVDRSMTGEFKLALYPWEKDVNLHVDGEGQTTAEKLGLASRAQRPGLHPGFLNNYDFMKRMMGVRRKDLPMERALLYFKMQSPPDIQQKELQKIVDTRVSYQVMPVSLTASHVWIDETSALMPITLQIANNDLQFDLRGDRYLARVGIYGKVTSMTGEVIAEFEEVLNAQYNKSQLQAGRSQRSVFQRIVAAEPGRYKIELVAKDLNSGNLGTVTRSLLIPSMTPGELTASPVVLAERVDTLDEIPERPESFVIGDVRVIPNVTRRFETSDEMGVYCQVHNVQIDQSTLAPSVEVEYEIQRNGRLQARFTDRSGSSINYASTRRVVLVRSIPLSDLQEGDYELIVRVNDLLSGKEVESKSKFHIQGS
ncbi:MAG TPA: GWxTD domain-containing protein [Acidobacteriota bacterium]|nr:GWxTD domain-containing protein [Acidobacteriota bacterium]